MDEEFVTKLATSAEERLFMGSLQEKRQNNCLEEEDLIETRNYFYFKKTVLDRCMNELPKIMYPEVTFRGDENDNDQKRLSAFLQTYRLMSIDLEKERLKMLEKYIIKNYFQDLFYMTIAKLQSLVSSLDRRSFRRYRKKTGAGTYLEVEYRVRKNRDNDNNAIRGIEAYIINGKNRISMNKLGVLTTISMMRPDVKETISKKLKKFYPGLEQTLEQVSGLKILKQSSNENHSQGAIDIKLNDGKSIVVSCPPEIRDCIMDEIMVSLTNVFIGRNIALDRIEKALEKTAGETICKSQIDEMGR